MITAEIAVVHLSLIHIWYAVVQNAVNTFEQTLAAWMTAGRVLRLMQVRQRDRVDAFLLAAHGHFNRNRVTAGVGNDDHDVVLVNLVLIKDNVRQAGNLFHRATAASAEVRQCIRCLLYTSDFQHLRSGYNRKRSVKDPGGRRLRTACFPEPER